MLDQEHPWQQPRAGVDHDARRELAARQHVVADRQFLVDQLLDQPLIDALVASGKQQKPGPLGQLSRPGLRERPALRAHVNHRTARRQPRPGRLDGGRQGLYREEHARSAAVRPVIDRAVHVRGVPPRILDADRDDAPLDGPANDSDPYRTGHEVGEQRHDLDGQPPRP